MISFFEKTLALIELFLKLLRSIGFLQLASVVWQKYYRQFGTIVFRYKGEHLHVNNEKAIFYQIAYSIPKLEELVNGLPTKRYKTALDIGANCGIFSYFLKKKNPSCKIYLFEPSPFLEAAIRRNLQGFSDWELIKKAVATRTGNTYLYINNFSQSSNSLYKERVYVTGEKEKEQIHRIRIKSTSLDRFIADKQIENIDIIKIDVQGLEREVLKGAKKTLGCTRSVLCEVTFLFPDFYEILKILLNRYRNFRVVSETLMGADIYFFEPRN